MRKTEKLRTTLDENKKLVRKKINSFDKYTDEIVDKISEIEDMGKMTSRLKKSTCRFITLETRLVECMERILEALADYEE